MSKFHALKELKNICKNFKKSHKDYRTTLYASVAKLALIEPSLRENTDALHSFYANSFWEKCESKPDQSSKSNLLYHMIWRMYGKDENHRKRAWRHATAIKAVLASDIDRQDLVEVLKSRGGFSGVLESTANTQKDIPVASADHTLQSSLDAVFTATDMVEDDDPQTRPIKPNLPDCDISMEKDDQAQEELQMPHTRPEKPGFHKGEFYMRTESLLIFAHAKKGQTLKAVLKCTDVCEDGYFELQLNKVKIRT